MHKTLRERYRQTMCLQQRIETTHPTCLQLRVRSIHAVNPKRHGGTTHSPCVYSDQVEPQTCYMFTATQTCHVFIAKVRTTHTPYCVSSGVLLFANAQRGIVCTTYLQRQPRPTHALSYSDKFDPRACHMFTVTCVSHRHAMGFRHAMGL